MQLGLDSGDGGRSAADAREPGADGSAGSTDRFLRDGVLPQFGDYVLLSEIARGGMGIVYRARQRGLDRLVAVKLILAGQLATRESVERFRREAQAAAQLHHPGIVPIYEIGEHETQHFFSMELIDGVSLAECLGEFVLSAKASPSERRQQEVCIAELLTRVARALDFAHQHGVLHRDVKPSNILIDQHGLPRLTDFGLAKLTGREGSGLTLTNTLLGSPSYLAPEQAAGRLDEVTGAADVYGLGATLYELLTGRPPFLGSTAVETMWMAIHQNPVPPRQVNPVVPRDLETIALRCLEKRPEQRYPCCAFVASELERFVRREPILARPVSPSERVWRWCQRRPALASMACALVLTILFGSGTAFWQWRRAERANVRLRHSIAHLQWDAIDETLRTGQSSAALAKVASLLRDNPTDWKAAMFGMSVLEQRRFPIPNAPPLRHPDGTELTVARLSPDGTRIVTASFDGTARVWDAVTSKQVLPELQHRAAVNWAEFSPDGRRLATASDDQTARLWDAVTGRAIGEPLPHAESVERVHFSRDGRWMLTRTSRTVSLFDAGDGRMRLGPLPHDGRVVAARFLADGATFFSAQQARENSLVQAWNVETGELRLRLETGPLTAADLNADASRAVTVHADRAYVWDVASGARLREIVSHNGWLVDVAVSPRGDRLATVSRNDWVRVWSCDTGFPLTPELPHYYLLNGLSFLGDGDRLMSWGDDALVQVWDSATGEPAFEPLRHSHRVLYAEIAERDGEEIFLTTFGHLKWRSANTRTGAAQLWRVHDRKQPLRRAIGRESHTYDACGVSYDGRYLALGQTTPVVWVLRTDTGEVACGPLPLKGLAWGVLFTPDGSRLITTTSRGQVAVRSLPDGKLLHEPVELPTTIQPVEMTHDGRYFATGSTDGMLRLWDVSTGRPVREMKHGSEINAVSFSPDGHTLASAGEDRIVRLWDTRSGRLLRELAAHQNEVLKVVFSPDGRRLATASPDFTARLWDAASGQQLRVLPHQGEVVDVAYCPDGRIVATGSRDRTVVMWDADTGLPRERGLLHRQAVRNVRFSPDGQRLLTLDFRGPRLWDVASGHPLTVPLPQNLESGIGFQSNPIGPHFTPDGNSVFVATSSADALLWQVPVPPAEIPVWFPEFLEAVAGLRLETGTDVPALVPPERFLALRQRLLASTDTDYYTRWTRQWLDGTAE